MIELTPYKEGFDRGKERVEVNPAAIVCVWPCAEGFRRTSRISLTNRNNLYVWETPAEVREKISEAAKAEQPPITVNGLAEPLERLAKLLVWLGTPIEPK